LADYRVCRPKVARGPQPGQPVNRFDRFAEAVSQFVSQGVFFTAAVIVVLLWLPTILFISSIDTWQLVINTLTSVLAFLLIALLQNSERRYDDALHRKIDTIAAGRLAMSFDEPARLSLQSRPRGGTRNGQVGGDGVRIGRRSVRGPGRS
jgi:ABC-type multidrug transport system fused ATPase/permease subunit